MMCLLVLLGCLWVAPGSNARVVIPQENLLHRISLRVEGPLDALHITCGPAGSTHWKGKILRGETRVLTLPVSLPESRSADLAVRVDGSGSASVEGWLAPVARLPSSLLSRPVASPMPSVRRLDGAAALLLMATLVGALGFWRRPSRALLVGMLGSAALLFLPAPPEEAARTLRVFEGHREGGRTSWVRTDAGVGSLTLAVWGGLEWTHLRVLVPEAVRGQIPVNYSVVQDSQAPLGIEVPPGVRLALSQPVSRILGEVRPELQAFGSLAQVWTRGPGGQASWNRRGPWGLGESFPDPIPGPAPPGWLAAGLPQGRGVLLGQIAPGGPGTGDDVPDSVWVRLVGFAE